jgi:hypothetical protein
MVVSEGRNGGNSTVSLKKRGQFFNAFNARFFRIDDESLDYKEVDIEDEIRKKIK